MRFLDDPWRFGPLVIGDPGAVLLGLFISGMGLLLLAIGITEIRRARASKSWPLARARVIGAGVRPNRHARGATTYEPVVQYAYEVDGEAYTSTRVAAGEADFAFEAEAVRFVERYPAGAEVTIRYAPGQPALAALEPGLRNWGRTALRLVFGVLIGCAGLPFLVLGFIERPGAPEPTRGSDGRAPLLESGPLGYLAFGVLLVGSTALFIRGSRRKEGWAPWVPFAVTGALVGVGVLLIQLGSSGPFPSRDALILAGVGLFQLLGFWLRRAGEAVTRGRPK